MSYHDCKYNCGATDCTAPTRILKKQEMSDLKPCPFCGSTPVFPDAKDVYGTCYDAGCEECCIAGISLQITDCFDWPRDHVHKSWNTVNMQYGIEYIEAARQQAIEQWNTRDTQQFVERACAAAMRMAEPDGKGNMYLTVSELEEALRNEFK